MTANFKRISGNIASIHCVQWIAFVTCDIITRKIGHCGRLFQWKPLLSDHLFNLDSSMCLSFGRKLGMRFLITAENKAFIYLQIKVKLMVQTTWPSEYWITVGNSLFKIYLFGLIEKSSESSELKPQTTIYSETQTSKNDDLLSSPSYFAKCGIGK